MTDKQMSDLILLVENNLDEASELRALKEKLFEETAALERKLRKAESQHTHKAQKGDVRKIEHLNKVLRGIRLIGRLIAREKEPGDIIRRACRYLVEEGGFQGVRIVLTDDSASVLDSAAEGFDDFPPALLKEMFRKEISRCCREAGRMPDAVVTKKCSEECGDCPFVLLEAGETMATALSGEATVPGFIYAALPGDVFADENEQLLFKEAAEDIALALAATPKNQERFCLAQADRFMEMLAAGVTHEINNPLAYVLYNLESLSKDVPRLATKIRETRFLLMNRFGEAEIRQALGELFDILDPVSAQRLEERFNNAVSGANRIKEAVRCLGAFSRIEPEKLTIEDIRNTINCAASLASKEEEISEQADALAEETPEVSSQTNGRVLVVDDEPGIRTMVRYMLEEHEVIEAESGRHGREILGRDSAFDVIICDMMMPSFSGMDLYDWLCESRPNLAERLVFITGGAFTPRAKEYLSKTENRHIEKPFTADKLRQKVSFFISTEEPDKKTREITTTC